MAESLEQKIQGWLRDQGYPLEMEVASHAVELGFDVSQSDYYFDQDDGKPREIDLIVSKSSTINQRFRVGCHLCIECKSGKKKPWLLLAKKNHLVADETGELAFPALMSLYGSFAATEIAQQLLMRFCGGGDIENIFPRLNMDPLLGYGLYKPSMKGATFHIKP